MTKKEDLNRLDEKEQKEIVRRVVEDGKGLQQAIEEVERECRDEFKEIIFRPDSIAEEHRASNTET